MDFSNDSLPSSACTSPATFDKCHNKRLMLDGDTKHQDSVAIQKGLEAIVSSLSLLSTTLGSAIEEGLNLVEKKATHYLYVEPKMGCSEDTSPPEKELTTSSKLQESLEKKSGPTKDTQLKASRDVAMAMATKAKLLLRELKNVKADLTFSKSRCVQLEGENKRLRESVEKGVRHEEEDLVRLQLEALLAEKARLAQENAAFARENQFLHEMVQYHQLTLQNVVLQDDDESLMNEMAGLDMDAALCMDFLPDEEEIIALEESVKVGGQADNESRTERYLDYKL